MELARQLEVARGTVQARMEKLQQRGVVTGYGPDVDLRSIGYDVVAFVTLEISQGALETVVAHLSTLPEVLEVHTTTGPGDLLCRVAAPTNADLQPRDRPHARQRRDRAHHHPDRPHRADPLPGAAAGGGFLPHSSLTPGGAGAPAPYRAGMALIVGMRVLAHQGGWDEMLMVLAPLLVFAGLLVLARRRAEDLEPLDDASGPADGADEDREPAGPA